MLLYERKGNTKMTITLKNGNLCSIYGDYEQTLKDLIEDYIGIDGVSLYNIIQKDKNDKLNTMHEQLNSLEEVDGDAEYYASILQVTINNIKEIIKKSLYTDKSDILESLRRLVSDLNEIL